MDRLKRFTLGLSFVLFAVCAVPDKATEQQGTFSDLSNLEQEVHQLINRYRILHNLPPLSPASIIARYARAHSQAMAEKRIPFGHGGFAQRVEGISWALPHMAATENVAYNNGYPDSAQRAVEGWLASSEHRRSIQGNYRLTGIGVAKDSRGAYYFTQIFWQ